MRAMVIGILVGTLGFSPQGNAHSNLIGWFQVPAMSTETQTFAEEKQFMRWLENQPSAAQRITDYPKALPQREWEEEKRRIDWENRAEQAMRYLLDTGEHKDESAVELFLDGDEKTLPVEELGSLRQRIILTQAVQRLIQADGKGAREKIVAAIALHPEGDLAWDWESVPSGRADVLNAEAENILSKETPHCDWEIQTSHPFLVNGFSFEKKRLKVRPGRYALRNWDPSGRLGETRWEICQSSEKNTFKLPERWEKVSLAWATDPRAAILFEHRALETSVYRRQIKGDWELLGKVKPDAGESWTAIKQAWEKASMKVTVSDLMPEAIPSSPVIGRTSTQPEEAESERWYNKGTFWIVAGSVLAAAGVAFLSTRGSGNKAGGQVVLRRP